MEGDGDFLEDVVDEVEADDVLPEVMLPRRDLLPSGEIFLISVCSEPFLFVRNDQHDGMLLLCTSDKRIYGQTNRQNYINYTFLQTR